MMQSKSSRRAPRRGFTVVELMMALAIFGVGITGIVAMQSVSATANRHAKDLATATALARSWQDRLAMDSSLWGGERLWPRTQTTWINTVPAAGTAWQLPANDPTDTFGPAADAMGRFVNVNIATANLYFCTHIRLTQLLQSPGSNLIRTEVRVFWPKGQNQFTNNGGNYCTAAAIPAVGQSPSDAAILQKFHFVYKTSAVRQVPEL